MTNNCEFTLTQIIAAHLWFKNKNKRGAHNIAAQLEISLEEVRAIQASDEYLMVVENLIMSTRSPDNILEWMEKYPPNLMPGELGERMGLSEITILGLMEKVLTNLGFDEEEEEEEEEYPEEYSPFE